MDVVLPLPQRGDRVIQYCGKCKENWQVVPKVCFLGRPVDWSKHSFVCERCSAWHTNSYAVRVTDPELFEAERLMMTEARAHTDARCG
jgi:hypothetical protein